MLRLQTLCVLLIIAVYANAISHNHEVQDDDETLKDIDSPESVEDGDVSENHIYQQKYYRKHSWERHSQERGHSWEKPSREHGNSDENWSLEAKNRPTISDKAVILPHEKYCKYFYVFDNLEGSLASCSKGHRFDAEKSQCLRTKEVNCGKRKKNVDSSEENGSRINFKCPKWSGFHQHEYYCNLYYRCQNSKKGRLFMCPPGMLFDEYSKRCADRHRTYCNKRIDPNDDMLRPTPKPETFVCPSSSGKYPHERNCGAFYVCDRRRYRIQYCSKGKLYNERKRTCESENKVTCGSRIHPDLDPDEPEDKVIDPNPSFNCRESFSRHNHDQYCNWYYQCHDRRPSVRQCRRGWRYHSHRGRCREEYEVTCDGKPDHEDATTEEITTKPIPTELETTTVAPTASETTSTPTEPETTTPTPTEPETTTPTPTEPETSTPTPTEPETTTPTPTKPEATTTTPTKPETTPTPTEPETTTPTPTEPETTPSPTEPEATTPTPTESETTPIPTEPETTTPPPTDPETTTPTPTEPEPTTTTTTEEPTTTKPPKVTAPDTDCDEDDVDCIIDDLGITPDWFVCPEDIGSYPHPSSKKLFIFCLNWKPSVKKCGQDLLYSEDLRTCVHP